MIAVVGTALSVLVLGFPSEGLPQDSVSVPTIQASVPVVAEIPQALVSGEIVDASGAPGSRTLTIPRAIRPPKMEDFVNGGHSGVDIMVTDFRQRDPGDGIPVSQRTAAYLSYDDKNLYVVFVCQDEPGQVRARMSRREDTPGDDSVSVFLDTFHGGQEAYYFSANPLGIQSDGILTGSSGDGRFDTLWHSDGQLTSDGYITLLAIPFKSLRFSSESNQTWGIGLGRYIARTSEHAFWPFITRRVKSQTQQLGAVEGLKGLSTGHNIQLMPYATYTNARLLDVGIPRYNTQTETRAGLDAKMVLGSNLTLDFTANPDFSQVESDDPQVTVNRRFEVFFPEKRPFFLDNIGYFETSLGLLFTRRIADPQFGARLTGKVGRWNLGLLATDDRAPGKVVDTQNSRYGKRALVGAARFQREFGKDSSFGILATERAFGLSENRVSSADTKIRLTPTWYVSGQAAYSDDRSYDDKEDVVPSTGTAYSASLTHGGRNFTYSGNYEDFSPSFRAPLGFVPRVGIRTGGQYAGYFVRPENSKIYSFGPSVSVGATWDHARRLQDKYSNVDFSMDFAGPVGFTVTRYDQYESYLTRGFRYGTTSGSFYANWLKRLSLYGSLGMGTGVNYSTPAGLEPFVGNVKNASFGFTWRPEQRIRFDEYYYYNNFRAPRGFGGTGDERPGVFASHIARSKVNFQFTRALSLRAIVDYYFLSPNTALFNSDRYKQLTGDVLLTYMIHPGTALYIGYNSRFENLETDPSGSSGLHRTGPPIYPSSSQLFVKLSYLLRY